MDWQDQCGDRANRDRVLSRLTRNLNLTENEQAKLNDLLGETRVVTAEREIFREGENYPYAAVILDGWAHRYKLLEDGRKQTFNFVLPSEVSGVAHALGKKSIYTVEALTDCRISTLDVTRLLEMARSEPRLAVGLIWDETREIAMLQEHMTSLGRRTALESLTHLILELQARLRRIGEANGSFEIPVTQKHLADMLGLSEVHVSRTLKQLRKDKLIDIYRGKVVIHLQDEAEDLAEFSQIYLE